MANSFIRENPVHAPAQKPLGQTSGIPQIGGGGAKHVASMMQGPEFAHLGHFQQPHVLMAGHNTGAHPGFKAVQASIAAKEGVSKDRAGAILAASSRHASAKAKRANPKLKRVKG